MLGNKLKQRKRYHACKKDNNIILEFEVLSSVHGSFHIKTKNS